MFGKEEKSYMKIFKDFRNGIFLCTTEQYEEAITSLEKAESLESNLPDNGGLDPFFAMI